MKSLYTSPLYNVDNITQIQNISVLEIGLYLTPTLVTLSDPHKLKSIQHTLSWSDPGLLYRNRAGQDEVKTGPVLARKPKWYCYTSAHWH